jgi:hypothetical protein
MRRISGALADEFLFRQRGASYSVCMQKKRKLAVVSGSGRVLS